MEGEIKEQTGWIAVNPNGRMFLSSIKGTKEASQAVCAESLCEGWIELEQLGYRCIPVKVTPIKEDKN